MTEHLCRFAAMGSECSVTITADDLETAERLAERATATVGSLERLWSRFRPDSEVSALARAEGAPLRVDPRTFAVLELAVAASRLTGGLFDPTLGDALVAAGYDRSFDQLPAEVPAGPRVPGAPGAPRQGVEAIRLVHGEVAVAAPVQIDLGGIGKGRAADLVVAELRAAGAHGACVDLGGDIGVFGRRASGDAWAVAVDDPFHPGTDLAVLVLDEGAVATSSRLRRRWRAGEVEAHHLLDPRTLLPAMTDLVTVTVVAADAVWAEVFAKAALIAGELDGAALIRDADLCGLLVTERGDLLTVGPIDRHMLTPMDAPR